MKKILVLCFCLLFALSLLNGCGQKKEAEPDTSAAGHPEEVMDSTRMDSAAMEVTPVDTTGVMEEVEGAVEDAAEEVTEEAGH
ncbi:MAG: hypothetical protein ACOYVF_12430 [Candidatus Zixiibacteriota bacterium]